MHLYLMRIKIDSQKKNMSDQLSIHHTTYNTHANNNDN